MEKLCVLFVFIKVGGGGGGVEGGGFPTMLTGLKSRRKLMGFQTDFFHFKDLRSPIIRMKTKQSLQVQNYIGI